MAMATSQTATGMSVSPLDDALYKLVESGEYMNHPPSGVSFSRAVTSEAMTVSTAPSAIDVVMRCQLFTLRNVD
jgi:hypothetical protein